MSEEEKKIEKANGIVDIAENIIEFNRQQQGQGWKILEPNQMLRRLPISLVQLKSRNNSEKLKNEIKQILYFLYRSKKLTKQFYKSLIEIIQKWKQSLWTLKIAKQVNHTDLNWIWQINLISKIQTKIWL